MGIWGFGRRAVDAAARYDGVFSWGERLVTLLSWLGVSALIAWFSSAYDALAAEGWGAVALVALFGGLLSLLALAWLAVAVAAFLDWRARGAKRKGAIAPGELAQVRAKAIALIGKP